MKVNAECVVQVEISIYIITIFKDWKTVTSNNMLNLCNHYHQSKLDKKVCISGRIMKA